MSHSRVHFIATVALTALTTASLQAQTTLVADDFTYTDGLVDVVATGGSGWAVAEGGWQTGNSVAAQNRFEVISEQALYQGGGVGTYTEQNRTFATAITASSASSLEVSFNLLRPETQGGRGIGLFLTNGGTNQFMIGKKVNGSVGLHSGMTPGSTTFTNFASSGSNEAITATITFDGTDTSIVLADSNETLDAHVVPGALTFDGISLAGYNGATIGNGIDNLSITETPNPDPWLQTEAVVELVGFGGATTYSIPISNLGATLPLNISSVSATGFDEDDVSAITFPASIAPLTSDSIGFTFTPSFGSVLYTFDLEVISDDANASSPFVITVDIDVTDPAISVDTTPVDLGSLPNNPGPQTHTVSVTNLGDTENLVISAATLTGSSAFSVGTLPGPIAPGATDTFDVTFDAGTEPGTFDAVLTIESNDATLNPDPEITFTASTALPSDPPLASFTFGSGASLDLTSSDTTIGSAVSDITITDLTTNRFEFDERVTSGSNASIDTVDGNALGWTRREAPNNGLDLTTTAPNHAYSFTITPAAGVTLDLATFGWLNLDLSAFASIGGPTGYNCALTVDDGNVPFTIPPVTGPLISSSEQVVNLTFDVRNLGLVTGPVTFTLMPQTTGNTNGVVSQAGGYIDNVQLFGTENIPLDPVLDVTTPTVFVTEGLAEPLSIPTLNTGQGELTITSVTTDGSPAAATIGSITFTPTLAASGGTGAIDFVFTPNAGPGVYNTSLNVASNDPSSPTVIALEITVRDPEISAPASFNFASLPHNPTASTGSVTVSNDGETANLVVSAANIGGSSAFTVTSLPGPIAPGETGDIVISFDPGIESGRLLADLTIESNDFDGTIPSVALSGFSDPAGIPVARFNFDPAQVAGTIVDLDGSAATEWTTGDLIDEATGTGAISAGNQSASNRAVRNGADGSYLAFSSNREGDAQTPIAPGGNNESTWTTFQVSPQGGGGSIDFTGGTAIIDTYAFTSLGSNTSADWTLYYSTDGGTSWISLGTSAGAASSNGSSGPLSISWDLSPIGNQGTSVDFILDPVSTGGTNGNVGQRGIGFDNLIVTVSTTTPGTINGFDSWATDNSITNDPTGDTDKDGINELLEYALGLDPNSPDGSPGVLTNGVLSFTKGAEAALDADLAYVIQESDDLGDLDDWSPVSPDTDTATEITYTLPSGKTRVFARLVIVRSN